MTKREQAMQNFKTDTTARKQFFLRFPTNLKSTKKRLLSYRRRSAAAWAECAKSAARSAVCLWSRGLNTVTPILRQKGKGGTLRACPESCGRFQGKNGSIICKELLGVSDTSPTPEPRTAAYYKKRPCVELVGDAAELLENLSGK